MVVVLDLPCGHRLDYKSLADRVITLIVKIINFTHTLSTAARFATCGGNTDGNSVLRSNEEKRFSLIGALFLVVMGELRLNLRLLICFFKPTLDGYFIWTSLSFCTTFLGTNV